MINRRLAPGLDTLGLRLSDLLGYQREWLRHDAVAGVSVAAVALPTAIAYAELIGFELLVGLYAAVLPLLVYAIFGTSRHLIVNPDAATCAMIGTTLMPLTAVHANSLMSLSIVLAIFTGIFCILAGLLRLGFVADFMAKPILVGFLNGVAIHIFLGQIGKVFGFSMKSHGIVPSLLEFIQKVPQTHLATLAVGVLTIGVMLAGKRWLPKWPAPLLAVVFAVALIYGLDLEGKGVAVVGQVPPGLPRLRWPEFDPELIVPLLGGALGVALLRFSNAIVVARSFAAKGRYEVDVVNWLVLALRIEAAVTATKTEHLGDAVAVVEFEKKRADDVIEARTQAPHVTMPARVCFGSKNSFARGPASSNLMPDCAPISIRSGMRTSSLIV
jgi:MFS superfamily sulfate permease-like transporter